jgi:hypothetical protein
MIENVLELSPKQSQAIRSLLAKPSINEAAKDAGVNVRTIHRWMGEPAFRQALTQAEDQAINAATRRLVGISEVAVAVIASIMADRTVHAGTRLRAAQAVLDNLLKLVELRNLSERISALEVGSGHR